MVLVRQTDLEYTLVLKVMSSDTKEQGENTKVASCIYLIFKNFPHSYWFFNLITLLVQ